MPIEVIDQLLLRLPFVHHFHLRVLFI
jgi:hypothetical protein